MASVVSAQNTSYDPYLPGKQLIQVRDSVQIGGTTKDTSQAFSLSSPDNIFLFVLYDSRADSINVRVYLDISPDGPSKGVLETHWKQWAGLDTCIVSGTADSSVYKQLAPGIQFPYGAGYGRLRTQGLMMAADSCRVTESLTITRQHLERLR